MKNQPESGPAFPPSLGLAVGVVVASTSSILIRFAQPQVPSMVIASYRMAIASLILAPIVLTRYREDIRRLSSGDLWRIGISGVFLALHFVTWISSLEYTSVASSVVLVQTMPLFVALLSPLLLHEPGSRGLRIGLTVAMLGSLLVGFSDLCPAGWPCTALSETLNASAIKGDLLALGGAVSGAGYVMLGRQVRPRVSLISYIGLAYFIAAVVLIAITLVIRLPVTGFPSINLLWLLLLALGPQLLAHSTYNWALKYLPAAVVSLGLLGEPVGSTILALLLLNERPPLARIIGGGLILTGIAVATRLERSGRADRASI